MRKTIPVKTVVEVANLILAATDSTADGREAVCVMLENVLFDAGQYGGYRYLDTAEIEGNGSRREYFMKGR